MKDNQTTNCHYVVGCKCLCCYPTLEMSARHSQEKNSAINGKNGPSVKTVRMNTCLQLSQENEPKPASKMWLDRLPGREISCITKQQNALNIRFYGLKGHSGSSSSSPFYNRIN